RHTRLQGDWRSDVCSSDLCLRHFGFASDVFRAGGDDRDFPLPPLRFVGGVDLYRSQDAALALLLDTHRDCAGHGRRGANGIGAGFGIVPAAPGGNTPTLIPIRLRLAPLMRNEWNCRG